MKICGIYKITNTITGDFYIGSSNDVKRRWMQHKWQSTWNRHPDSHLYQDFQKFGLDKFIFEIIEEVEIEKLKETEQKFIETLKPTYNSNNAKGLDIERRKEYRQSEKGKESERKYRQSEKGKETSKKASRKYNKSDKGKEVRRKYNKEYEKTDKRKKYKKEYNNQLCLYNGETLTLCALYQRFKRQGIDHPTLEAKKYLM